MSMIYPMFVLVLMTFVVGMALGLSRKASVRKRHVNPMYYRLMQGDTPPEYVRKLDRNFSNLLEVPVLFYVLGAIVIATGIGNTLIVGMAWVYVALRLVHSAIHITYNYPPHRFLVFLASGLVLLAMWVWLLLAVGGKA